MNNYNLSLLLSENVVTEIKNFALMNYLDRSLFKSNGDNRQFCILNQTKTPVTKLAVVARKKIYQDFGIKEFEEEPLFGIFLGVNTKGGFVHQHTDPTKNGFYHLRINFLLSKPHKGGMPIINHKEFTVDEGGCWLNLASEWVHGSTPVEEYKPRIVLSLGSLIEKKRLDPILKDMGIE